MEPPRDFKLFRKLVENVTGVGENDDLDFVVRSPHHDLEFRNYAFFKEQIGDRIQIVMEVT
jgi:hypothetical protein